MNVQVKTPEGEVVTIAADGSWTCAQFKKALQDKIGVPVDSQKLTVGGKIMKDNKNLSDFPAAASQTVSLVVAGGAKPASGASSGSSKGGERQQVESLINEVIQMVKSNKEAQALAEKYQGQAPPTDDLQQALGVDGVESVKQKVLDELTKVLEGDWTPFNKYHAPLRVYALKLIGEGEVTEEKRNSWIDKASSLGMEQLSKYPSVQENIEHHTKPGRDMIKELLPVAKMCARRLIDLFLDGASSQFPDHPAFSDQLRLLLVTTVGALLDTIIDVLEDGKPKCQELMAKLCGQAINKLCEKMPDYATLFAFGGPMAMNQVLMWHEEYAKSIKGKTFIPPRAN